MDTLYENFKRESEQRNLKIIALRKQNIPVEEIARLYGITPQRVSKICEVLRNRKSRREDASA